MISKLRNRVDWMAYLKSDEEVRRKFEEDDAILRALSGGQEALVDDFQCYKAGYDRGKAEERKKVIKIFDDLWNKEAANIDNGVYAYPFEAMQYMIIKALDNDVAQKEEQK